MGMMEWLRAKEGRLQSEIICGEIRFVEASLERSFKGGKEKELSVRDARRERIPILRVGVPQGTVACCLEGFAVLYLES